jgi:uncharacterized protein
MSELNSKHNRAVWFDIAVSDLERAAAFYRTVLNVPLHLEQSQGPAFYVFEHGGGNSGCLVSTEAPIQPGSVLLYLNVDGRIRDALVQAQRRGGTIVDPIRPIGAHGFRAVILDCEGNRVALHSRSNA